MQIKFLGTSAGWPLPRLGCKCDICSSNDPRDKRTRSQLLINDSLLIDIGPDTYLHLSDSKIDPIKIKYAAITHEHSDHVFGLWDLGHIYNSQKIDIILAESTYKKISRLFFYNEYKVTKIKAGEGAKITDLIIILLPVNHTDSSFGILVKEKNKSIFYAPDFKFVTDTTIKKISGLDLAILDGSELKIATPTHQPIQENFKLGKKLKAKKVYFTHLGHRTLPHQQLQEYVQKEGGSNFHIPHDGLEIKL